MNNPENSPYFDKSNKKFIGKFKNEVSGIPINEFIGLKSKMYSYLQDTNECGKRAKGIKKNVIKKDIKHENYTDVLFNNKQVDHKMKPIQSQRRQLGSHSAASMTNDIYMTMEYTVTLMVITIYNLVHFLESF